MDGRGAHIPTVDDTPFRPRRARTVGLAVAGALAVVLVALAVGLSLEPGTGWGPLDTASTVVLGLLLCGGLVRLVSVRAVPTTEALVVRNVVLTRRVRWDEVLEVRFGRDDPWLVLGTADGEDVAVMAVQRSDGEHAQAEARRLARMVTARAARPHRS
ncbi:PH domain-containing protein [Kineococcus sp. TRM81007]|uniref:PH domain-containing protein n=1 Tax=Kineococcus sp. TRM81007 TaxID=2925831 RepID=UPI001F580047|nr:PH domain-containing protein [Kineococcus sp. TRM81007]MCI2239072.1 PH domain-containing protein [Kineococcus sp. TRM81007]